MPKKESCFTMPVFSLILLSFILGTSEFVVIGILPDMAAGTNSSIIMIGNLISLFALFYAVSTPFITAFISRYNRYRILLILVGIFILGNILCGIATNYFILLISRIIIALVSGTILGISMTFPNDIISSKNRPTVISWIYSGFSIASVFGVPIGTIISQTLGWRYTFFVLSLVSVITFLLLHHYLPRTNSSTKSNVLHQFSLFKSMRIQSGMIIIICSFAGSYSMYTYLTPILQGSLHIPDGYISTILCAFGFCTIISNLASGKIANIGGIRKMPYIYLSQAIALALIPFTVHSLILGLMNILFLGITIYMHNASIQIFFLRTAKLEQPDAFTLASSLNPIASNIGIALGSATSSAIISVVDIPYVGIGGAIFVIISLLVNLKLLYTASKLKKRPHIHIHAAR